MKNIINCALILLITSPFSHTIAQSLVMTFKMPKDTAHSVFAQERYSVYVQASLPTDSVAIYNRDYEIRFLPDLDWKRPYSMSMDDYPMPIAEFLGQDSFGFSINILAFLSEDSTLRQALIGTNHKLIELRYVITGTINLLPFSSYYSTIDSFYLPPGSTNDWQAYDYLLAFKDNTDLWEYSMAHGTVYDGERQYYEYLSTNYATTLIGQIAKCRLFTLDFSTFTDPSDIVKINQFRPIYLELSQSKSATVRGVMLSYYYQYYRWH